MKKYSYILFALFSLGGMADTWSLTIIPPLPSDNCDLALNLSNGNPIGAVLSTTGGSNYQLRLCNFTEQTVDLNFPTLGVADLVVTNMQTGTEVWQTTYPHAPPAIRTSLHLNAGQNGVVANFMWDRTVMDPVTGNKTPAPNGIYLVKAVLPASNMRIQSNCVISYVGVIRIQPANLQLPIDCGDAVSIPPLPFPLPTIPEEPPVVEPPVDTPPGTDPGNPVSVIPLSQ